MEAGIFSKDASGTRSDGHFEIEIRDGVLRARFQSIDGSEVVVEHPGVIEEGDLVHVAATWEKDGDLKLYVDGQFSGASSPVRSLVNNTQPIGVGYSTSNSDEGVHTPGRGYWAGLIDDVAVWDTPLSPDALAALAESDCVIGDHL